MLLITERIAVSAKQTSESESISTSIRSASTETLSITEQRLSFAFIYTVWGYDAVKLNWSERVSENILSDDHTILVRLFMGFIFKSIGVLQYEVSSGGSWN